MDKYRRLTSEDLERKESLRWLVLSEFYKFNEEKAGHMANVMDIVQTVEKDDYNRNEIFEACVFLEGLDWLEHEPRTNPKAKRFSSGVITSHGIMAFEELMKKGIDRISQDTYSEISKAYR